MLRKDNTIVLGEFSPDSKTSQVLQKISTSIGEPLNDLVFCFKKRTGDNFWYEWSNQEFSIFLKYPANDVAPREIHLVSSNFSTKSPIFQNIKKVK